MEEARSRVCALILDRVLDLPFRAAMDVTQVATVEREATRDCERRTMRARRRAAEGESESLRTRVCDEWGLSRRVRTES